MRVSWCSLVLLLCTLWEPCALFSSIYYFLQIKKKKKKDTFSNRIYGIRDRGGACSLTYWVRNREDFIYYDR